MLTNQTLFESFEMNDTNLNIIFTQVKIKLLTEMDVNEIYWVIDQRCPFRRMPNFLVKLGGMISSNLFNFETSISGGQKQ